MTQRLRANRSAAGGEGASFSPPAAFLLGMGNGAWGSGQHPNLPGLRSSSHGVSV